MRLVFAACLALLVGCHPPLTAWRRGGPQAVEVVWPDHGAQPEASALLAQKLGLRVYDTADPEERVLCLTLAGSEGSTWAGSLPKSCLMAAGLGFMEGVLLPLPVIHLSLVSVEVTGGIGLIAGVGSGIHTFIRNRDEEKKVGYSPWFLSVHKAELLFKAPGESVPRVAYRTPRVEQRPFQKALPPEAATKDEIRRQSLLAYVEALAIAMK